ncbi:MAG: efflux RND transporter permease subunit [Elusimicrobia bacterium]|nr:efflux RND transporter permease subunit [Elusimicrobiota bacterium]
MTLPEFSIKKPIATVVFYIVAFILSFVALTKLNIDIFPEITYPVLTISTWYDGAGPEDIENKVTKPIELTMGVIDNLKEIRSTSIENNSIVELYFDYGTNLDTASNDVRASLDISKRILPSGAESPILTKFNLAQIPMIVYQFSAKQNFPRLRKLLYDLVAEPLKKIEGVGNVYVGGVPDRAILVNVDKTRLNAYKLSLSQVVQALALSNIVQPAGTLTVGSQSFFLRLPAEFSNTQEMNKTLIGNYMGKGVYLNDIAGVEDGYEDIIVSITRQRYKLKSAFLTIQKQATANTVAVANQVYKIMELIKKNLPKDIDFEIGVDLAQNVQRTIDSLRDSIYWGGLLVVIVTYLFLFNVRISSVILVTIPTSLIVSFFFLYIMKYTLNIMSLSAIAIAIGMVVDNAIVVTENIMRHRTELGEGQKESAIKGANEVFLAISASTFTTVVVFLALIFTKGLVGVLFKQLAYVVTITLLISLVVSLTLSPMIASFIKFDDKEIKKNKIIEKIENLFKFLIAQTQIFFHKLLLFSLDNKKKIISFLIFIFAISLGLVNFVGTEFFPSQDSAFIQATIKMPVNYSVTATDEFAQKLIDETNLIVGQDIEGLSSQSGQVYTISQSGGGTSEEGQNLLRLYIRLKPKEKRKRSEQEIVNILRNKYSQIPGPVHIEFTTGDPLSQKFGGAIARPLVVEIAGVDYDVTDSVAVQIADIMRKTNGVVEVKLSREKGKIEYQLIIDRSKLAKYGIPPHLVADTIGIAFKGKTATLYRDGQDEYPVIVKLRPQDAKDIKDVLSLNIRTPDGRSFVLSDLVQVKLVGGFQSISRKNQQRYIMVTGSIFGRSLGEISRQIEKEIKKINVPPGVNIEFGGTVKEMKDTFKNLYFTFLLGIILVYLVMAAQFESFRDPFIIMFSVPFGFVGVIWSLFLTNQTLNVNSFIGLIMLTGIVVNNAIVFLTYTIQLRAKGFTVREALVESVRVRLRPILMTTITTLAGVLPLAISQGQGAEAWKSLAIAVIGGLSCSTFITLIIVPIFYDLFEGRLKRFVP